MLTEDLRVLIVGDNPLARAGMTALLATQPGLAVVGQVAADGELADAFGVYRPDVLAWEIGWDAARSLDVLTDMRDAAPPAVLLLPDETHAADAVTAGARGVLPNNAAPDMLTAALEAAARGLMVLHPTFAGALPLPRTGNGTSAVELLTPREHEVLNLLAEGLANKTIAGRLKISEHTVKFHVNAVMGKLGVQSRTEAVVRATRLGLISL